MLKTKLQIIESLRTALIEGEKSGTAGKLDIESIKRKGRKQANNAAAKQEVDSSYIMNY